MIYLISLAVLFGLVLFNSAIVFFHSFLGNFGLNSLRRWLIYSHVWSRRLNGSYNMSFCHCIILFLFAALTVFGLFFHATDHSTITQRAANISLIHLVLLSLGGSSTFINDKVLRLPLRIFKVTHYWLGRICVAHITVHAITQLKAHQWRFTSTMDIVVRPSS